MPEESVKINMIVTQDADEPGYSGWVVELPGVITQGDTMEELKSNMREAAQLFFDSGMDKKVGIRETENLQLVEVEL